MKLIGRKEEVKTMKSFLNDEKAQLLAVVGRRRVGKTFLIRETYAENIVFEMTGLKDADLKTQLLNFNLQMNEYFQGEEQNTVPDNWLLAFNQLSNAISDLDADFKPVVFFDEVPWLAGKRSGFIEALAHWWNNWASQQNIILVICGSAASWMLEHVVNAKGGLHNRISKLISLMPFTLAETKEFLDAKNVKLSHYQIVQLYMTMGGIPHYLNHIIKGKSATQMIQILCFTKDGILRNEFENLYAALFDNASNHIKIIKALASKSKGLDRQEILKKTKMTDGGWFSGILNELEASGFITSFEPLAKKKKDTLFRLTDEYSIFYLNFIEGHNKLRGDDWEQISVAQKYKIWCGYAFENLGMKHVRDIKRALGVENVYSTVNSFMHRKDNIYEKGFQIDLLLDRKDDIINICEMKFHTDEFRIDLDYSKKLRAKREGFKAVTGTRKMVHSVFITVFGVLENKYKNDHVDHDLTIDIFFD